MNLGNSRQYGWITKARTIKSRDWLDHEFEIDKIGKLARTPAFGLAPASTTGALLF